MALKLKPLHRGDACVISSDYEIKHMRGKIVFWVGRAGGYDETVADSHEKAMQRAPTNVCQRKYLRKIQQTGPAEEIQHPEVQEEAAIPVAIPAAQAEAIMNGGNIFNIVMPNNPGPEPLFERAPRQREIDEEGRIRNFIQDLPRNVDPIRGNAEMRVMIDD